MKDLLLRIRESIGQAARPNAHSMIMRQPHLWSRGILWTIMLVAVLSLIWAVFAHMDEVVHATGKLEPKGSALDVQSPVQGVISEVLVKEGDVVKTGQILVKLDPKVATAELAAIRDLAASLKAENASYDQLLSDEGHALVPQNLPRDVEDLAKDRASLLQENKLLRAQTAFSREGIDLDADQARFFDESEKDRSERLLQADLKAQRAEKDLESVNTQLAQARRLRDNSKRILDSYSKLVNSGGVSRVDYLAREAEAIQVETQMNRLEGMVLSLNLEISRAREEARNTNTAYRKEAMTRLNDNNKKIAEIESRLSKARLANVQRLSEIESRLAGSSADLGYHEIKSPADGIVFEVVTSKPGTVVVPKDSVLKLVPSEELIAKVDITNRDIGFLHPGQSSEVEIASFPSREYGYLKGKLTFVGSDALPPTQQKPFYSFPAKIQLDRQWIEVRGARVPLQSGMAVSANIKTRSRRVITMFFDFLLGPVEKLREVR